MFNGPDVRAEHGPSDPTIGGVLNADRKQRRGPPRPRKNAPEVLVGDPKLPLEVRDGAWDQMADITHVNKGMTYLIRVKAKGSSNTKRRNAHNGPMDVWPQRMRFKVLLALYQTKNKKTQQKVADELGISLGHLRNIMYRDDRRPSLDVLKKACVLFGVSVTDFIDDPNALPAGQDMSDQSDQARFLATVMVQDLMASDLTDEDRQELWEDFQRGLARIRKRRAQGK